LNEVKSKKLDWKPFFTDYWDVKLDSNTTRAQDIGEWFTTEDHDYYYDVKFIARRAYRIGYKADLNACGYELKEMEFTENVISLKDLAERMKAEAENGED